MISFQWSCCYKEYFLGRYPFDQMFRDLVVECDHETYNDEMNIKMVRMSVPSTFWMIQSWIWLFDCGIAVLASVNLKPGRTLG